MSGYGSSSKSESSGSNMGMQNQRIAGAQLGNLKQLWGAGTQGILNEGLGAANEGMQQNFLGTLQNNPLTGQMMQFANPNNQMAQDQIDILSKNLSRQFNEQMMPQIQDSAIQGGGLGGSRQGVAEGIAMRGTQDALASGSTQILSNIYNQANQTALQGMGLLGQQASAGIQGLGWAQQQQLAPLLALTQILGNPTVLSSGMNMGRQSSSSSSASAGGGVS